MGKLIVEAAPNTAVRVEQVRHEFSFGAALANQVFNGRQKRGARLTDDEEQAKARALVDYYRICFAHPAVEGILMWGFWEGANWIPVSSLYRRDWTPTPAAEAYRALLFKEWWTSWEGKTDEQGRCEVPGFFGKHRVTVGDKSVEVELTKAPGAHRVQLQSAAMPRGVLSVGARTTAGARATDWIHRTWPIRAQPSSSDNRLWETTRRGGSSAFRLARARPARGASAMQRDWRLIGNPQAGAGRALEAWSRFARRLPEATSLRVQWTRAPGEATDLARAAAGQRKMVVAVGGDGTVNEVATGLIEAGAGDTALGILPMGTGNDAARALGVIDLMGAWEALEGGQTRRMDVIEVQCQTREGEKTRYSLVYAAAGFPAEILERTTPGVKRWAGRRGCYTIGFLRAVFGWRSPRMRIRCDGHAYDGRYLAVCAGNAEWVGGGMMRLSPGARWDDGRLNINLIPELSTWQALRSFPRLYRGTHLTIKGVRYLTATELELQAEPPTKVQVDGDVRGESPVRLRVLPGRLRVASSIGEP